MRLARLLVGFTTAVLLVQARQLTARSKRVQALKRPETWLAPSTKEQLEREPTLVPMGNGAIFVPCTNDPDREPP